jgi:hypothetical protein
MKLKERRSKPTFSLRQQQLQALFQTSSRIKNAPPLKSYKKKGSRRMSTIIEANMEEVEIS